MFAHITASAVSGSEISLPGFGTFKVKETPAREVRNATGATIKVAAAKKLTLAPAKVLKNALNS